MQWVLLTGDVMLGRGVDQLHAVANDPAIPDRFGRDAVDFVRLAEARNGPIERPVAPDYVWGEALDALAPFETALRIVNLETAITTAPVFDPSKRIHYRMHPANIAVLKAFAPDCCVLANNHVLDWGEDGLRETVSTLDEAGIAHAGAGLDAHEAWRPAILPLSDGTRVIVLAMGDMSSGVPGRWAATPERPGLAVLVRQVEPTLAHVAGIIAQVKRPRDIAMPRSTGARTGASRYPSGRHCSRAGWSTGPGSISSTATRRTIPSRSPATAASCCSPGAAT